MRPRQLYGAALLILNSTLLTKFVDDGNVTGIVAAVVAILCSTGMIILPRNL